MAGTAEHVSGLPLKQIWQIGGSKSDPRFAIDVALIQSLVRKGEVKDLVAGYGHVIVDECPYLSAVSFERVMKEVKAKYIAGVTATPSRKDGQHALNPNRKAPARNQGTR